jgi:hypothetical protein
MIYKFLTGLALAALGCSNALGCFSSNLDTQAVQWSKLIVVAKLVSIGAATPMSAATTDPSDLRSQICEFEIAQTLDGSAKPGDHIRIIRFLASDDDEHTMCDLDLTTKQIGSPMTLLLTPQADLRWSDDPSDPDPRTADMKNASAYALVFIASAGPMQPDDLTDLKSLISDTRSDESQFNPDEAKAQAETLAIAADDTEADQAEKSLTEMGPLALPSANAALAHAGPAGKERLLRVIHRISLPAIKPMPAQSPATN